MEKLKPWGLALKNLLNASGLSQNALVKLADMDNNEFYRMCRGSRGPGVKQLDRVLRAMNRTWHDWADAYEAVKAETSKAPSRKAKVHPFPIQRQKALKLEEEETAEAEKKPYYDAKVEIPYDIMADIEKFLMTNPTQKEVDRFYREYLLKRFLPRADAVRKEFEAALKKGEAKKRKGQRTRGTA